jgi:hypothetical protein
MAVIQQTVIQQQVQDAICNYLAACEPSALEEILEEIRIQCEVRRQILLPTVITAIAALQDTGKICEYDQMPLDDPLEYAWVLSEERFT